jgi:hypothetical protein
VSYGGVSCLASRIEVDPRSAYPCQHTGDRLLFEAIREDSGYDQQEKRTGESAKPGEVRMLTESEQQSLREANLKAHLIITKLIAEAERKGKLSK